MRLFSGSDLGRETDLGSAPQDHAGTSGIGSVAKVGARKTEHRPNPILARHFPGQQIWGIEARAGPQFALYRDALERSQGTPK